MTIEDVFLLLALDGADLLGSCYLCDRCHQMLVGGEWDLCCECEQQRQAESD